MTVVFGLEMRLHLRMCTILENGTLRNEQLSGSAVNNFFDQGNFEAMKTLSGWEAAHLVSCPTLCVPPGEKWSGERSQISWAYSPKRWKTNEIARSLIIT